MMMLVCNFKFDFNKQFVFLKLVNESFFFIIELESTNSDIESCNAIETIGASSSKDVTLVPSGIIKKITTLVPT